MSHRFQLVALAVAAVAGMTSANLAAQEQAAAPLRHVVLFKFKPEVTQAQVQEVVAAFATLPKKIDAITGFEWGTDVSVEMKAEGFTHCFLVSFKDARGRDEYLPHAAHEEFKKLVGPRVAKVLVFDFVGGK